jgi:competence protein ComEA
MLQENPEVTQDNRDLIAGYPAKYFGPAGKLNINKASAREMETALAISTEDTEAIVRYRAEKGSFKTLDDLKKVPGLDAAEIEAKKDQLEFWSRRCRRETAEEP